MQIRFTPRRGTLEMEISGIIGGGPLSRWYAGEVREVPDDQIVAFAGHDGITRQIKAVDVIFSCGPDFTDAATGRNPQFSCADCGAVPEAESFLNRFTGKMVPYNVDDDPAKPRLCTACYLARNPQFIVAHRYDGCPEEILSAAQERAAQAASPKARVIPAQAAPAPTQSAPARPPVKDEKTADSPAAGEQEK